MAIRIELTNKRFGKLKVIKYVGDKKWLCVCDCGEEIITYSNTLRRTGKSHCGCEGTKHTGHALKDIKGKKFGRLLVLERDNNLRKKRAYWKCLCDCGNNITVKGSSLISGSTKSCGCINSPDLTGKRFGKLVVINDSLRRTCTGNSKIWKCKCDCGNLFEASTPHLNKKFSTHCGCKLKERILDVEVARRRTIFSIMKGQAKSRKIEFHLTRDEVSFLIDQDCYYCGIEPSNEKILHVLNGETEKRRVKYQGVDRLNASSGYEIKNCVPCCMMCNKMKNNLSRDEFMNRIRIILERNS